MLRGIFRLAGWPVMILSLTALCAGHKKEFKMGINCNCKEDIKVLGYCSSLPLCWSQYQIEIECLQGVWCGRIGGRR